MKNLSETSIYTTIYTEFSNRDFTWSKKCSKSSIYSYFQGTAAFLDKVKNKDVPVAAKVCDIMGNFCIGAYVTFQKSEEEGTDDEFILSFTFDENDIEKNWTVYDFSENVEYFDAVANVAYTVYGMTYQFRPKDDNNQSCEGSPQDVLCTIFNVIKEYMRANVTIDPSLVITDLVELTAAIADDQSVVIGFEPSFDLAQMVKNKL